MRCPKCKLENPPSAQKCDCGYNFLTNRLEAPIHTGKPQVAADGYSYGSNESLLLARIVGLILVVVGVCLTIYFTFAFETSIAIAAEAEQMPERVQNFGLMQNQQNGIIGGLLVSILGGIFLLYGKE